MSLHADRVHRWVLTHPRTTTWVVSWAVIVAGSAAGGGLG